MPAPPVLSPRRHCHRLETVLSLRQTMNGLPHAGPPCLCQCPQSRPRTGAPHPRTDALHDPSPCVVAHAVTTTVPAGLTKSQIREGEKVDKFTYRCSFTGSVTDGCCSSNVGCLDNATSIPQGQHSAPAPAVFGAVELPDRDGILALLGVRKDTNRAS